MKKKDPGYYYIVRKDNGSKQDGPFVTRKQANYSLKLYANKAELIVNPVPKSTLKGEKMTRTKFEEEYIPACWVCGKLWQRMDSEKWYYFNEIVVCKDHPGALDWYMGALELSGERLRLGTVRKIPRI